MASRAGLKDKKTELVVDLGDGDTLKIYFKPNAYDEEVEAQFIDAAEVTKKALGTICDLIVKVVYNWDLRETDAKDSPLVPFNRDELKALGAPVVMKIFEAIMGGVNPDPKSSKI